jgi:HK97 family phage major capsid protein
VARAKNIFDMADFSARSLTRAEHEEVKGLLDEMRAIKRRLDDAVRNQELREQLDTLGLVRDDAQGDYKTIKGQTDNMDDSFYDEHAARQGSKGSITDQLLGAPQFKSWYKSVAPSGVISEGARGLSSPPVQVRMGMKALLTGASDTSAGAMVFSDRAPFVGRPGRRELTLRDLISVVPTESDTIEFAKWNSETNAAAPVAEATALGGTTGTKAGKFNGFRYCVRSSAYDRAFHARDASCLQ